MAAAICEAGQVYLTTVTVLGTLTVFTVKLVTMPKLPPPAVHGPIGDKVCNPP